MPSKRRYHERWYGGIEAVITARKMGHELREMKG